MTKCHISMATPLKFCALVVGLGLGLSLAGLAQSASAQSSAELIRCSSSSRETTIACCKQRYGNHPPVQQGRRKLTCAQAVVCKISLLPLTKVAFPQRCSIDPLLKGNDKGKGVKL